MIICNRSGNLYNAENFESICVYPSTGEENYYALIMTKGSGDSTQYIQMGLYADEDEAYYDLSIIMSCMAQHIEMADLRVGEEDDD